MIKSRTVVDKRSSAEWSLALHSHMLQYYVPSESEMGRTRAGHLHIRDFEQNHFSQNAKHLPIEF
jgi:hypothetical protein